MRSRIASTIFTGGHKLKPLAGQKWKLTYLRGRLVYLRRNIEFLCVVCEFQYAHGGEQWSLSAPPLLIVSVRLRDPPIWSVVCFREPEGAFSFAAAAGGVMLA